MDSAIAAEKLAQTRAAMAKAAQAVGRGGDDICLIAVTKTRTEAQCRAFLQAGHRDFGENRIQEAARKWPQLRSEYPQARLHFIGHLQRNKAADALALCDAIHSIDRAALVTALARAIERRSAADTKPLPAFLVQVNIGAEQQKSGCAIAELPALLTNARDAGLAIAGLMTIPPLDKEAAPYFALLDDLAARHNLPWRSMGMSNDYTTAIALGATHIRLGTALFT